MLDKSESFFGKKQKLKLQYKGKTASCRPEVSTCLVAQLWAVEDVKG